MQTCCWIKLKTCKVTNWGWNVKHHFNSSVDAEPGNEKRIILNMKIFWFNRTDSGLNSKSEEQDVRRPPALIFNSNHLDSHTRGCLPHLQPLHAGHKNHRNTLDNWDNYHLLHSHHRTHHLHNLVHLHHKDIVESHRISLTKYARLKIAVNPISTSLLLMHRPPGHWNCEFLSHSSDTRQSFSSSPSGQSGTPSQRLETNTVE